MMDMAFVNMATAEPQPGMEHELRERMKSFAKALGAQPGLVNVFVLREEGTKNLVGISIWRDKESFEPGMAKLSNSPSKTSVSRVPPIVRQFQEVD
jgi:heme-degrading monooxygenase HmoA